MALADTVHASLRLRLLLLTRAGAALVEAAQQAANCHDDWRAVAATLVSNKRSVWMATHAHSCARAWQAFNAMMIDEQRQAILISDKRGVRIPQKPQTPTPLARGAGVQCDDD